MIVHIIIESTQNQLPVMIKINLQLHWTVAYIGSKVCIYEHKPWESSQLEYNIILYGHNEVWHQSAKQEPLCDFITIENEYYNNVQFSVATKVQFYDNIWSPIRLAGLSVIMI